MITQEDIEAFQDNEEVDEIVNGWHDDFETMFPEHVIDTSRWSTFYEMVTKHKASGTFWQISWEVGSTEYQDVDFDPSFVQVYPHQITTTVYKKEPQK